ncbi:MAG: hypothetical protein OFPI_19240 [Osedax symbiont Rs2]|nr:MAG: hypothetical protein OFPI_19240 [Osedax symbiont Rs2]
MFAEHWQQEFNSLDRQKDSFLRDAIALIARIDVGAVQSPQAFKMRILQWLAVLDQRLSKQLSTVLAKDEFVALESLWRNLHSIATIPSAGRRVKIKMLDVSWSEIAHDLNTSSSIDRSCLYNFIGNRELNTLGGEPFGMFVVDHPISMEMGHEDEFDDIYTLELLALLGQSCLCPFTLTISDSFFGESGAGWISDPRRVGKILDGPDFDGWRRMRLQPEMKFIALVMPKILQRAPYKRLKIGFVFDEQSGVAQGLWGNAAFAFASIAIREFNRIGWFGFMKSRWQEKYQGAIINGPENANFDSSLQQPVPEIQLFGGLARFYLERGFIPVCHSPMTDKYFFYGNQSVWQPQQSEEEKVAGQIQAILMSCRIAHYLKVQIRNMIGSFDTVSECQNFLRNWIDDYSSNLQGADEKTLAKYPLNKGKVKVREIEDGTGGRFVCELLIQPQYQFDRHCGEILLSTDLGNLSFKEKG